MREAVLEPLAPMRSRTLYEGNKECPTRRAASASAQSYEARSCVVRWNGTKFIYKPL